MPDPVVLCSDETDPIFVWQEDVKLHICKSGTNGSIPHVNRCPVHVASCVASVCYHVPALEYYFRGRFGVTQCTLPACLHAINARRRTSCGGAQVIATPSHVQ